MQTYITSSKFHKAQCFHQPTQAFNEKIKNIPHTKNNWSTNSFKMSCWNLSKVDHKYYLCSINCATCGTCKRKDELFFIWAKSLRVYRYLIFKKCITLVNHSIFKSTIMWRILAGEKSSYICFCLHVLVCQIETCAEVLWRVHDDWTFLFNPIRLNHAKDSLTSLCGCAHILWISNQHQPRWMYF